MLLARINNDIGEESNHMCGKKSMLVQLNESVAGNVSFGYDSKVPVKEMVVYSFA